MAQIPLVIQKSFFLNRLGHNFARYVSGAVCMCPEHLIDFVIIYMYYILQRTTPVYTDERQGRHHAADFNTHLCQRPLLLVI